MLFEAGIEVLHLILLLSGLQALLGGCGQVGEAVHIHDTHFVNTVRTMRTKVPDQEIPLQLLLVFRRGPFEFAPPATCVDFGIVGEGLALKVSNPITELAVTRRDEASLLVANGVTDGKCRPTPVSMVRQDIWIYAVAQGEGLSPILRP